MAHGDPVFWSINILDVPRAKRFFNSLFDWTYSDPGPSGAVRIDGMLGSMHPSDVRNPATIWIRTEQMPDIVELVRNAGGRATDIIETPQGITSTIVEPDGVRLALSWGDHDAPPVQASSVDGGLAAWSVESTSAQRSAEFLGELFQWSVRAIGDDVYVIDDRPLRAIIKQADVPSEPRLCFSASDPSLDQVIARLGGELSLPVAYEDKPIVTARDDQGYLFDIQSKPS